MLFWLKRPYRFLLLYPTINLSIWTVVYQEYRNNLKQYKLVEHTRYLTEYKFFFVFFSQNEYGTTTFFGKYYNSAV